MPRLIFKCPYIKGGEQNAARRENYVRYISTREGVELVHPENAGSPATSKQKELLSNLLRDFPDSRKLFEYEDYREAPTRANTSELITRIIEDHVHRLTGAKEKYLKYIATRPRSEKLGSHGLFTAGTNPLALSQVAEEISNHTGNVWLPIFSLRREDAARLGYDNAERWRELLSAFAPMLADAMKIPFSDFRWYAAFHNESHHPHVHMVCYSAKPSEGFLTKAGIAQIRSQLAGEIFRQELTAVYREQTRRREELGAVTRDVLEELIEQLQTGSVEAGRLGPMMEQLSEKLSHTTGKKQYGYLKAPLKKLVDELVDELSQIPQVEQAYTLWYELREEVLRTHRDNLPERIPLSQQKEFKQIKNMVIREAVRLGELSSLFCDKDEEKEEQDNPPDLEPQQDAPPDVSGSRMEWSAKYRRARRCLFGGEGQPPDFEQAFQLLQAEAEKGNALAKCDLGRMLTDGLGREHDAAAANEWYTRSLAAFRAVEREKPSCHAEYRIGKLYAAGLGCEQDYNEAAKWFTASANGGYKYAQYSLAGLFYRGQGVEQNFQRALELYAGSAEQDFPYAAYELAKMYRDGVGCLRDEARSDRWFHRAFQGFCGLEKQSHDDRLQYRIGWMLLRGVGTEQDGAAAKEWFEKASRLGNPHAQYQLTRIAFSDPASSEEQIQWALGWLTKSAEGGNVYAQYDLGKLLLEGERIPKDMQMAVQWFSAAAEQNNQFAQYTLGRLYLLGKEIPKDREAAVYWLTRSAEQGNEYAKYFLEHLDDWRKAAISQGVGRLLHQLGNLFRASSSPYPANTLRITDRKLLRKLREKKQAMGLKSGSHGNSDIRMESP